ncbi:MAG TPA: cytochrome c [Pyrinomonadaceae bacterium]|nr:cytochrome c [Pyrinomonadaceae bacterium]
MSRFKNKFGTAVLLAVLCFAGAACRRDMQDQPKVKPYRGSSFFADGMGSRPPVQGTIARGYLRSDKEFYTGKKSVSSMAPAPASTNPYTDDTDTFPFPITQETVARGRERFDIFCSVCHGLTGHGDGMIVRRGFRKAASYHDDRLRQAPVGHFFDVITNGWGAMPSYAAQIPVQDRWAIIAYVRALQASQQNVKTQPGPSGTPLPQGSSAPQTQPTPASGGHQ